MNYKSVCEQIQIEQDKNIIRILEGYHEVDKWVKDEHYNITGVCKRCHQILDGNKIRFEECIMESIEKIHNS